MWMNKEKMFCKHTEDILDLMRRWEALLQEQLGYIPADLASCTRGFLESYFEMLRNDLLEDVAHVDAALVNIRPATPLCQGVARDAEASLPPLLSVLGTSTAKALPT
jgi:hypothetical protein